MKNEIRLDTLKDIQTFIDIVTPIEGKIQVEDGEGHCVNAKSLLGMMYASGEFVHKYVISEVDITTKIMNFII